MQHKHGADFFQGERRLLPRGQWTDEFRGRGLEMSANSGSGNMVGIAATSSIGIYRNPSQCSKGLCLRYCSIGQRDLQRQDFCNPRRNTGHLRMDVGKRSEPELHASNRTTGDTNITNFSTRASVQTGQGVTIAGFIITGTGSKSVVVRGLGSTLAPTAIQCSRSAGRSDPATLR